MKLKFARKGLLALALACTLMTPITTTKAAGLQTGEGYTFDANKGALVISTNEGSKNWREILPKDSNGNPVVTGAEKVLTITVSPGVTKLEDKAFYRCRKATSIVLPESLTSIGDSALYECDNLTNVVIPESVTEIGHGAFLGVEGLTEMPKNLKKLEANAFNTTGIKLAFIPNGQTNIPEDAFNYCAYLEKIIIPASVTSIEKTALALDENKAGEANIYAFPTTPPTLAGADHYEDGSSQRAIENVDHIYVSYNLVDTYKKAWSAYKDLIFAMPVDSMTLNTTSASLQKNETLQMSASILPVEASDQKFTWSSSDASIASVDAFGKVTALKPGKVTITATNPLTKVSATAEISIGADSTNTPTTTPSTTSTPSTQPVVKSTGKQDVSVLFYVGSLVLVGCIVLLQKKKTNE